MPRSRFPSQPVSASLTLLMLGMLGLVVLIDVGASSSGVGLFARVAYWSMAVGIAAGLIALTAQLVDLVTTAADVAGRPHLGILSAGTTGMLVTFAVAWWLRDDGRPGPAPLLALEALAFAVGLAAAVYARWFFAGGPPPRPAATFPRSPYRAGYPLAYRSRYGQTVPYRIAPTYVPSRYEPRHGSTVPSRYAPRYGSTGTPTARLRPVPPLGPTASNGHEPAGAHRDRTR
jgi:uncharacterized membrane protein